MPLPPKYAPVNAIPIFRPKIKQRAKKGLHVLADVLFSTENIGEELKKSLSLNHAQKDYFFKYIDKLITNTGTADPLRTL